MIQPYFQIDGVKIFHGDCRTILPYIEKPDVVMTDPVWPNCPEGLLIGWEAPEHLFAEMFQVLPVLPKRLITVMRSDSDPRFLRAVPDALPFFRCQILHYVMPNYIGRKLGGDEIAYCFGEPIPSGPGTKCIPGHSPKVQPNSREVVGHPCSRVIEHFRWLCRWWTLPGELLIDPFMGSGTTLIASRYFGLSAIGIEIEERYCEIAAKRLTEDRLLPM